MTIAELKEKSITELTRVARTLDIPGATGMRKADLIFKILQAQAEKEEDDDKKGKKKEKEEDDDKDEKKARPKG